MDSSRNVCLYCGTPHPLVACPKQFASPDVPYIAPKYDPPEVESSDEGIDASGRRLDERNKLLVQPARQDQGRHSSLGDGMQVPEQEKGEK